MSPFCCGSGCCDLGIMVYLIMVKSKLSDKGRRSLVELSKKMTPEEKFTTVRVPIEVKKNAEMLRQKLQQNTDLRWLGHLALGAIIGYAIGRMLEKDDENEQ